MSKINNNNIIFSCSHGVAAADPVLLKHIENNIIQLNITPDDIVSIYGHHERLIVIIMKVYLKLILDLLSFWLD